MPEQGDIRWDPLIFWAKLRRDPGQPVCFHPLLCHMVDVAQVTELLWREVLPPAARRHISENLHVSEEKGGRWVSLWAGLHDIGKASPAFQLREVSARARLSQAGLHCPSPLPNGHHGAIAACVLPSILEDAFRLSRSLSQRVATVVGGHHGVFPHSDKVVDLSTNRDATGRRGWPEARLNLARQLGQLVGLPGEAPMGTLDNASVMVLAGLVSVADWIGSDETWFQYERPDDIAVYVARAAVRGRQAGGKLAWMREPSPPARSFAGLFPKLDPRPVQTAAVSVAQRLDGPSLVVIEAPMGEGKTEAAIYLADWAAAATGQAGCYFALPTQATSNQMFSRVRDFLAGRYADERVQMQLLHGHAALSAEFEALKKNASAVAPHNIYDEQQGARSGSPPNVVAAEWFTHRKRGLLSPFGVGTIDQALLAVLQTKHVFVRLFGLAHKPVILDEVHAYDTYMSALLERLLEWLGALGSSVVLLSATLPSARRQRLVNAYGRGLGRTGPELPPAAYPRITWVSKTGEGTSHVETSEQSTKQVRMEWVDGGLPSSSGEPFELGERLLKALASGGCAAIICNTVGRAQQVYLALKRYFPCQADDGLPELDLLHARFLFKDREEREKRSLRRFGKPGVETRRPHRAVLVATQVIEQSLDLDFDLMVTDLAPADLVLQRSGRLHRHRRQRPAGIEKPELWLCRPDEKDGVPTFGRGDKAVYEPHILLRSWLDLRGRSRVSVPGDVEAIIEGVYDERACPQGVPQAVQDLWQGTRDDLAEEVERDGKEAEARWVKAPSFSGALWRLTAEELEEDAPEFHKAHQALTRLSDTTVPVVFLYDGPQGSCLDADGLQPVNTDNVPTMDQARELLMRSISVSDRRVVYSLLEQPVPAGWQRSPLLRHHRLVTLDGTGAAALDEHRLGLDNELGLTVTKVE